MCIYRPYICTVSSTDFWGRPLVRGGVGISGIFIISTRVHQSAFWDLSLKPLGPQLVWKWLRYVVYTSRYRIRTLNLSNPPFGGDGTLIFFLQFSTLVYLLKLTPSLVPPSTRLNFGYLLLIDFVRRWYPRFRPQPPIKVHFLYSSFNTCNPPETTHLNILFYQIFNGSQGVGL